MAHRGQTIDNKATGERVTFLETAKDTNGELLRFELRVRPGGHVAANHVHPDQEETLTIRSGTLKFLHGKELLQLKAGDTHRIPKGIPHEWWNEQDHDMVCEVSFTPAGNTEVFLEQLFGLGSAGKCDAQGRPSFLQIMVFANRYKMYADKPPVPLQRFLAYLLAPVARLAGLRSFYPTYSKAGT